MNSGRLVAGLFLLIIVLVAGCSSDDVSEEHNLVNLSTNETGTTEEVAEDAVRMTISMDGGKHFLNETEVPYEEDKNLLHLLKINFFVEEENGVITSIERARISEEKQTEWVLFVNDEQLETSPAEYIVQPGDKIQMDLQAR